MRIKNKTKKHKVHGGMIRTASRTILGPVKQASLDLAKEYGKEKVKQSVKVAEGIYNDENLANDASFIVKGQKTTRKTPILSKRFKENVNPNIEPLPYKPNLMTYDVNQSPNDLHDILPPNWDDIVETTDYKLGGKKNGTRKRTRTRTRTIKRDKLNKSKTNKSKKLR